MLSSELLSVMLAGSLVASQLTCCSDMGKDDLRAACICLLQLFYMSLQGQAWRNSFQRAKRGSFDTSR